jgi:hypothetical protein
MRGRKISPHIYWWALHALSMGVETDSMKRYLPYQSLKGLDWNMKLKGALEGAGIFSVIILGLLLLSYSLIDGTSEFRGKKAATFGPFPIINEYKDHYKFDSVYHRFGNVQLERVDELSKEELHHLILSVLPTKLGDRFQKYLPDTLEFSQKYKIDPFWVMAIMWTESHFVSDASSRVKAQGLMQIMPKTGGFLSRQMKRGVPAQVALKLIKDPKLNIEMGVFYLKRLLGRFNSSFRLATVAYNMGPGWVRGRLRNRGPIGVRNLYLTKVKRAYLSIVGQVQGYLMYLPKAYQKTLVVKRPYGRYRRPGFSSFQTMPFSWATNTSRPSAKQNATL